MSSDQQSRPCFIVHADDVPEEVGRYRPPFDAEALSFTRELGVPPGR